MLGIGFGHPIAIILCGTSVALQFIEAERNLLSWFSIWSEGPMPIVFSTHWIIFLFFWPLCLEPTTMNRHLNPLLSYLSLPKVLCFSCVFSNLPMVLNNCIIFLVNWLGVCLNALLMLVFPITKFVHSNRHLLESALQWCNNWALLQHECTATFNSAWFI